MAILKCKICGGDMELSPDRTFGTCEYCGSTMTLPKIDDELRAAAFNRGNHFRRAGEFDKALQVYEKIVSEDPNDAEAHWCCALCRFGIEWVEDPASLEYLPTCHRASFDPFTEDVDCKAAIELSDGVTRRQYQKDAARIAEVQKGILAASQNEKPYDVFICYKESDGDGNRTVDSVLAQEIYYQLTEEGLRVFFARITLEDKAGSQYEPYIFAALNSAKAMVVVGTKPEYFGAVWVKNEWSRYLSIVKRDRKKVLLPCYRDMDPYDLPEQLSILQSYDMSKIGFMQDLIRGIKKIVSAAEQKQTVKETVVVNATTAGAANVAPLLERVGLFLEDGKWQDANIYCEKVLDIDPKNAEAYLGKLMAELQVRSRKQLADCAEPFDGRENYGKVLRFGDEKLETEMRGYITHINERNENARLTGIYNGATSLMNAAKTEGAYKSAAETFKSIPGFKDADALVKQCLDKAEVCRKDAIYASARSQMTACTDSDYEIAINVFRTIPGWRDTDEQIAVCQRKIDEIKAKKEAERIAAEKAAKKRKIAAAVIIPTVIVIVAFMIVLFTVIIPNAEYNAAMDLYNAGKYDEAIAVFNALNGYKDSAKYTVFDIQKKNNRYVLNKYNGTAGFVSIPQGVSSIGSFAFSGCTGLTSVTIPDSVVSIEGYAFSGCTGLTSINVSSGNTKYHSAENCIIETASKALIAGCKNSVIPADDSVTTIGYAAFSGCTGLTSVTIPDSVTSIGYVAFSGCTGLTSVTIGNGVTSIGNYAFNGCTGLTRVTIPARVSSIGDSAFRGCTGLTSVSIPDSVTSIGYQAFSGCTGLTSVTIPARVSSIGEGAFSGCTGLKTVYYRGSWSQWSKISISSYNYPLDSAEKVYDYKGK